MFWGRPARQVVRQAVWQAVWQVALRSSSIAPALTEWFVLLHSIPPPHTLHPPLR